MADALAVLSFVGQVCSGAIVAYRHLQTALDFPSNSSSLALGLEIERVRLELWARNTGADQGRLPDSLLPFSALIVGVLEKTKALLENGNKLKEVYGLESVPETGVVAGSTMPDGSTTTSTALNKKKAVESVRKVFKSLLPANSSASSSSAQPVGPFSRVRWAIVSQPKFTELVAELRRFTTSLNELLRESQQQQLDRSFHVLSLQAISSLNDPETLREVGYAASGTGVKDLELLGELARRKGIVVSKHGGAPSSSSDSSPPPAQNWSQSPKSLVSSHFTLPTTFFSSSISRCIAQYHPPTSPSASFTVVEKKSYDPSISHHDKSRLLFRLFRLMELLNSPASSSLDSALLRCLGYWSAPEHSCWCIAFSLPPSFTHPSPAPSIASQLAEPLSLYTLLTRNSSLKPPLEVRLSLASKIASTLGHLYGSKWMHKGIRSSNILFFPSSSSSSPNPEDIITLLSSPYITGFDYTRPYTDKSTIDQSPLADRQNAAYRHPKYQGPAAKGYKMGYDVYSFGLVLAEILWWKDIASFLSAVPRAASVRKNNDNKMNDSDLRAATGVQTETVFGADDAMKLRKILLSVMKKELAFRVGSQVKDVLEWCLGQPAMSESAASAASGIPQSGISEPGLDELAREVEGVGVDLDEEGRLAVEFYERCVVPLERSASAVNGVV